MDNSKDMPKEFKAYSLEDLNDIAQHILRLAGDKRVFSIFGAMGAGKTTFIKRLCRELGVLETVSSPTFSLVNEYRGGDRMSVYHFDFYRINNLEEAMDIGPEDYFDSGSYCFIEWPELIKPLLPAHCVRLEIVEKVDHRLLRLSL